MAASGLQHEQIQSVRAATAFRECEKVNFVGSSFINTTSGLSSGTRPNTCIGTCLPGDGMHVRCDNTGTDKVIETGDVISAVTLACGVHLQAGCAASVGAAKLRR
jgi:hypothetical protein